MNFWCCCYCSWASIIILNQKCYSQIFTRSTFLRIYEQPVLMAKIIQDYKSMSYNEHWQASWYIRQNLGKCRLHMQLNFLRKGGSLVLVFVRNLTSFCRKNCQIYIDFARKRKFSMRLKPKDTHIDWKVPTCLYLSRHGTWIHNFTPEEKNHQSMFEKGRILNS